MRKIITMLAVTLLAASPAMAQTRSFCGGAVEVNAGYRGASDANGNYVEYYAFVSGTDPQRLSLNTIIQFNAPSGVTAAVDPARVNLGGMGRARVRLATERQPTGQMRPSIPRGQIVGYVTVTCS